MKHLSHSSLTKVDNCLKQVWLSKLQDRGDMLPVMPAKPRDVGILVHSMIEGFFKGTSPLETLAGQGHMDHYEEALSIFNSWRAQFTIEESSWLFSERDGSCNVEGVPIPLIGRDDFVYEDSGVHVLLDFKTSRSTSMRPSYLLQGDFACLRYEREFPLVRLASQVDFVRGGGLSKLREWTPELRAATIIKIQALWAKSVDAARTGNYPATPGEHCTFCDYRTECASALRLSAAHLVVTDAASALATLREIALFEEAVKTMKEALKPYCAEYGDISTGDGKYDHRAGFSASGRFTVGKG